MAFKKTYLCSSGIIWSFAKKICGGAFLKGSFFSSYKYRWMDTTEDIFHLRVLIHVFSPHVLETICVNKLGIVGIFLMLWCGVYCFFEISIQDFKISPSLWLRDATIDSTTYEKKEDWLDRKDTCTESWSIVYTKKKWQKLGARQHLFGIKKPLTIQDMYELASARWPLYYTRAA